MCICVAFTLYYEAVEYYFNCITTCSFLQQFSSVFCVVFFHIGSEIKEQIIPVLYEIEEKIKPCTQ